MASFLFRILSQNPAHTRVSVYAGDKAAAANHSRSHAGTIVFRTDEWEALQSILLMGAIAGIGRGAISIEEEKDGKFVETFGA